MFFQQFRVAGSGNKRRIRGSAWLLHPLLCRDTRAALDPHSPGKKKQRCGLSWGWKTNSYGVLPPPMYSLCCGAAPRLSFPSNTTNGYGCCGHDTLGAGSDRRPSASRSPLPLPVSTSSLGNAPTKALPWGHRCHISSCLSSASPGLPWHSNSSWTSAEPQPFALLGPPLFKGLFASPFCSTTFQQCKYVQHLFYIIFQLSDKYSREQHRRSAN